MAVFSISASERKRAREKKREKRRTIRSRTKRDKEDDCGAETGGKAREKREVMSSAFAQPLTGLYGAGRECIRGSLKAHR